jgi:hypothetical protein
MMSRTAPSAALLFVLALSLAPQALVCGAVQKHECSCCGEGNDCTCCDIVPLYPEQAAAAVSPPQVAVPAMWTAFEGAQPLPADDVAVTAPVAGRIHGPPPLQETSRLRL